MKAKELRLALVFFGGVSLAVYQHGINREILNLVRASRLVHDRQKGQTAQAFRARYPDEPSRTTGDVYLQFLQAIGQWMSLRVLVDVIAGSSAGALNGIALARAVAHDLSLAPLTDTWLAQADMLTLLAPEARARPWSKWILRPLVVRPMLERLQREGMLGGQIDAEVQERISVFLRSRWFKPPLDGPRLSSLVLEGLSAMEPAPHRGGSLMPPGTSLDLMVTVTDFRGLDRSIYIHDPPMVNEREHRSLIRFHLDHDKTGHLRSEFDLEHVPSLAFAARASASYPGAFPAAQLGEMDDLLAARHIPWPTRSRFIARNFSAYHDQGRSPDDAVLVDGSILNNKPLMATLETIRAHSAFREVDRRLVYIDPHSVLEKTPAGTGVPSYFATLRGALSDLPRTDPTYNELADVSRYNKQVRRLKEAIEQARPEIARLIEMSTGGGLGRAFTLADLRHWRIISTNLLASTSIVYDTYMRSLVLEGVDFVAGLIVAACRFPRDSAATHQVLEIVEQWARQEGVLLARSYRIPEDARDLPDMPAFGRWIVDFGLIYKKRRLNFVLHEINDLYGQEPQDACSGDPEDLDLVKMQVYKLLDDLCVYDDVGFLSNQALANCRSLFTADVAGVQAEPFVRQHQAQLAGLIRRLAVECNLARRQDDADTVLSSALIQKLDPRCRNAILGGYLGFFYWDCMLRPAVSALGLDAGPLEEILVDRISPDDALSLASAAGDRPLLGGAFGGFGGFLSRAARENDYLWGRLHAVDRLFDILASAVPVEMREGLDLRKAKGAAFACVLEEEGTRLTLIPDLLARVREAIAAFEADSDQRAEPASPPPEPHQA